MILTNTALHDHSVEREWDSSNPVHVHVGKLQTNDYVWRGLQLRSVSLWLSNFDKTAGQTSIHGQHVYHDAIQKHNCYF